MTEQDLLYKGICALGFSADEADALHDKMTLYADELLLFNSAYDLVGAENRDDIIVRHILDSLSAANLIRHLAEEMQSTTETAIQIGDIGSGGGLPGIPLAAALTHIQFTLVERMSKRCAFLENCVAVLGLKNVTVRNMQAEQMPSEQLDVAVFRAFRPLDKKMTSTLLRLIKPTGKLAAYKAKTENIITEMQVIEELTGGYKTIPLVVPFLENHERNLVVIQKK